MMKKMISILLTICMLCFLFMNARSEELVECGYSITTPYEFLVRPGNEAWEELSSTQEMVDAMQIPEDILEDTSTEALIITMLESDFILQFMVCEDSFYAIKSLEENYNIFRELQSRPDYVEKLIQIYENTPLLTREELEKDNSSGRFFDVYNLEVLIAFEMTKTEKYTKQDWSRVEKIYEDKKRIREESDIYGPNSDGFIWFAERSPGKNF